MLQPIRTPGIVSVLSWVVLVGACGGQSLSSNGGDAGSGVNHGGAASQAGSSSGGATSTAGAASKAGESSGGTGSGGGSTAGGAAGAGSSSWSDECSGPPTAGDASCSAAFMYYTHDAERGVCRPFLYGGCGGTKNVYKTLAECQAACSNGTPSYDTCEKASDCVLGSPGCCSACDGPSLTPHDFLAYNRKYGAEVATCGDVACGACPEPEGERTYKYFIPSCVENRCVVQDLRETAFTECEVDTDCRLRHGTGCCQACSGGADDLISVRSDGSFESVACEVPVPCPACVPAPIEQRAVCNDGRCAIGSP